MLEAIDRSDECQTSGERTNLRRYLFEMVGAMVLYAALLIMSVKTIGHVGGEAKYLVAIMPVVGGAATIASMIRFGLRLDELQRQSFVTAAAIAGTSTALITFALGFLENAGVPGVSMIWVLPITIASWGVALPFVLRRYR